MIVSHYFLTVLMLFTCKTFAIQFGFTLKETDYALLNGKFVAFGTIPEGTSSKVQSEMQDFMNTFLAEELRKRNFEGIERQSFNVKPKIMTAMQDGRTILGLAEELSTFLKLLRYSCKGIRSMNLNSWKNAIFFSEPVVIVDFNDIGKFTRDLEVVLDEVTFIEDESDEIYSSLMKSDDSIVSSTENETLLPSKKLVISEEENIKYCCFCTCS